MPSLSVFALLLLATSEQPCSSVAQCNRLGSEALQAGRFEDAARLFEWQIDFAHTALREAADDAATSRLEHALQIAINNAALTQLRSNECLRARAWLEAADTSHKATQANRRQLDERCVGKLDGDQRTGQFWQYVGHGAWNSLSIRPSGDETLRLDAFWMRVGRGPVQEWGPAAFGELQRVNLHLAQTSARGAFEGYDPAVECHLHVNYVPGGITVAHTDADNCRVGGAGAHLGGRYWRVGDEQPLAE
ncbi:MAG: hypothetical protein ACT4NL_08520 [Pseudomarimonas sp.]